jgi:hypothetical protein
MLPCNMLKWQSFGETPRMSTSTLSVSAMDLPGPIRAAALRHALIAGAQRVIARRDLLNKINVFPVPDGDTGTNLAFTLGGVLAGALSRRTQGAGERLALRFDAFGMAAGADGDRIGHRGPFGAVMNS